MTEADIDEAFGSIAPAGPIWGAITELLQRRLDEAMNEACLPGLPDHIRQFKAGQLYNAINTRDYFLDRMEAVKARQPALA